MSEHFTASNGYKIARSKVEGLEVGSICNDGGYWSSTALSREALAALVEYAATIGIHAPSSAPTIDADTLNAIIIKVATRHTVELDVVQMLEARGFEVASLRNFMEMEAKRGKPVTNPDATAFRDLEAEALAGMTDEERERFVKAGGRLQQVAELPTVYKSEDDQGRPVLDGVMIRAVCQTISQMFGPHLVMTTSGALRTPGEAGLGTAEWEEFRAWKAERDARLLIERTEEAVDGLLREAKPFPMDRRAFKRMLHEFVQLANAGEIDLGEAEGQSDGE